MTDELNTKEAVKQAAQTVLDCSIQTGINLLRTAEFLSSAYLFKSMSRQMDASKELVFEGLHHGIEHAIKSDEGCATVKNTFGYDKLLGGNELYLKNVSEVVEVVDDLRYLKFYYTLGGVKHPIAVIPSGDKDMLFVMVTKDK